MLEDLSTKMVMNAKVQSENYLEENNAYNTKIAFKFK